VRLVITVDYDDELLVRLWLLYKSRVEPTIPEGLTPREAMTALLKADVEDHVDRMEMELESLGIKGPSDVGKVVRRAAGLVAMDEDGLVRKDA